MNPIRGGVVVKVQKWGNSLGLRIPATIAQQVNISEGTEVVLSVDTNQTLVVKPLKKKPTLEELLAKITPENKHHEIDFGTEGNEHI
ncbi:AbrB/MazE/SpoVT family DNA-binding domain-containing protein [Sporosarcina thermotolerans]|uniref:AbrB/MazE/SpoVT family DNA-binding domain-containing protein n=1 Tax=Sporosarcina thermotolerans TaxID=633404 RepID=A0AAW9AG44_9BACL|nr:AbrB/MazE/SpoVT family DNA-binding domain-containing protein [Sporosarcina thermotolerans]MDW0118128.1 AbrB/MazE/SpoVT family DNA-binding domain-containing protein [Sporosarcina thermotolerans]WHT47621.1 AbrB/MazE/SpoVT family DNA-binding domain-containing protein [Sporosarcina thermotolerans]